MFENLLREYSLKNLLVLLSDFGTRRSSSLAFAWLTSRSCWARSDVLHFQTASLVTEDQDQAQEEGRAAVCDLGAGHAQGEAIGTGASLCL